MLIYLTYASNEFTWAILTSDHLQLALSNHGNTVDADLTCSSQRKQTTFSAIKPCLSTLRSPYKLCLSLPIGFLHIAFSSIFKFPQVLWHSRCLSIYCLCENTSKESMSPQLFSSLYRDSFFSPRSILRFSSKEGFVCIRWQFLLTLPIVTSLKRIP